MGIYAPMDILRSGCIGSIQPDKEKDKGKMIHHGAAVERGADFAQLVEEELCADAYAGILDGFGQIGIAGAENAQKNGCIPAKLRRTVVFFGGFLCPGAQNRQSYSPGVKI